MHKSVFASALVLAAAASPALGNVHEQTERGFVIRHGADVPTSVARTWDMLVRPAQWWNAARTYSRDAANLSLEARPGGCFCEVLPNKASPSAAPRGGAEHMRVVYVEEGRALRMAGGLGPLQSDGAVATLTIFLRPVDGGTRVLWEYVVGGYVRNSATPAMVDAVLGEQLARLAAKLGGAPLGAAASEKRSTSEPEGKSTSNDAADAFEDAFEGSGEADEVPPEPDAPKPGREIIGR